VTSLGEVVGALVARSVEKAKRDPVGVAVMIGACLIPQVWPVAVGETLYWAAWWILLGCWYVETEERLLWTLGDASRLKRAIEGWFWSRAVAANLARLTAEGARMRRGCDWRHPAGFRMYRSRARGVDPD
jgi:hypothetical protein